MKKKEDDFRVTLPDILHQTIYRTELLLVLELHVLYIDSFLDLLSSLH